MRADSGTFLHIPEEYFPVLAMTSRRKHVIRVFSVEYEFLDQLSEYLGVINNVIQVPRSRGKVGFTLYTTRGQKGEDRILSHFRRSMAIYCLPGSVGCERKLIWSNSKCGAILDMEF
jgi:hypothetical protein